MTTAHERTEVTAKPCLELADEIAARHVLHVAVCYGPENERAHTLWSVPRRRADEDGEMNIDLVLAPGE